MTRETFKSDALNRQRIATMTASTVEATNRPYPKQSKPNHRAPTDNTSKEEGSYRLPEELETLANVEYILKQGFDDLPMSVPLNLKLGYDSATLDLPVSVPLDSFLEIKCVPLNLIFDVPVNLFYMLQCVPVYVCFKRAC